MVKYSQIVEGHGKYCSLSCARKAFAASDGAKDARAKAAETYKEGIKSGRIVRATGPENPLWKRHPDRVIGKRFPLSEKQKDRVREVRRIYLARNKEKAREWSKRRGSRKTGRLPRGTVARIKELQKAKCAICSCGIASAFHVDHIMPLAKGGKHEPHNIQLLCPTCNVRKSAKHPIKFAQQLGRLL